MPDVLFATRPEDWLTEASLPSVRMSERPARPLRSGGRRCGPRAARGRRLRQRVLHAHALRGAGRSPIETATGASRPRRRSPRRAGFLGTPIVDAYVELLWDALQRTWPRPAPQPARVRGRPDPRRRRSAGDARPRPTRRRAPTRRRFRPAARPAAGRAACALAARRPQPRSEQHLRLPHGRQRAPRAAQRLLLPRPSRRPARATAPTSSRTPGCARSSAASDGAGTRWGCTRACARIATPRAPARSSARLLRVAEAEGVRQDEWGGRQHFLRWTNPETWRNWEAAGLDYDSTLAYADAVGLPDRDVPSLPRLRPARAPAAAPARDALPDHGRHPAVLDGAHARRRARDGDGDRRRMPALRRLPRSSFGTTTRCCARDREKRWYEDLVAAVTAI